MLQRGPWLVPDASRPPPDMAGCQLFKRRRDSLDRSSEPVAVGSYTCGSLPLEDRAALPFPEAITAAPEQGTVTKSSDNDGKRNMKLLMVRSMASSPSWSAWGMRCANTHCVVLRNAWLKRQDMAKSGIRHPGWGLGLPDKRAPEGKRGKGWPFDVAAAAYRRPVTQQ